MLQEEWEEPDLVMSTDACLTGLGGWAGKEYFHKEIPRWVMEREDTFINELECYATLLGLKKWGPKLARKRIKIRCDNEVMVLAINTGRARNNFTELSARTGLGMCK